MAEFMQEIILWKPVYYVSIALLLLAIFSVTINPVVATIILFTLVSLWTRIPGLILPVARDLEMIDFFMLIIAVNLGGPQAAVFGVFALWFAKIFGPLENPHYTIKDSVAFVISGLLLPIIFTVTGSLLMTIYAFVLLRYAIRFIISVGIDPDCLFEEITVIVLGIPIGLITNTIFVNVFGDFTTKLISEGLSFSLELFGFVAIIILAIGATIYLRRFSGKIKKRAKEEFGHLVFEK